MTPSELKYEVQKRGSHFFDRKTMQFFGDTMKNCGCQKITIKTNWDADSKYCEVPIDVEVYELYRKGR